MPNGLSASLRRCLAAQGPLAGTTLKLRPWQKRFIRAVYKTDKVGNRLVRTAVFQ